MRKHRWLRFKLWLYAHADRIARRISNRRVALEEQLAIRGALPVGTCVRLTCCGCGFEDWHHEVMWTVIRFNIDPGDYYLETTEGPDEEFKYRRGGTHFTYSLAEHMRIIDAA